MYANTDNKLQLSAKAEIAKKSMLWEESLSLGRLKNQEN